MMKEATVKRKPEKKLVHLRREGPTLQSKKLDNLVQKFLKTTR